MQEKKSFKPYYNEFLCSYVCGNPYCNEHINDNSYSDGKCSKCNCSYDWHEDQ